MFFALAALVLVGIVIRLARVVADTRASQALHAVDDDLTGLSNRRHFLELVEREFARCRRYGDDGALLLIDADHLRRINEHLGQLCGDALLLEVTKRVGTTLRQPDLLARFGGAELAVFLPNTDPLGALDAAERIRQQVASAPYTWQQTHVVATVSIGVVHGAPGPAERRHDGARGRAGAGGGQGGRPQLRAHRADQAAQERRAGVDLSVGVPCTKPLPPDGLQRFFQSGAVPRGPSNESTIATSRASTSGASASTPWRCAMLRSHVIWRLASCRVAATPRSRSAARSGGSPASSASQAWR